MPRNVTPSDISRVMSELSRRRRVKRGGRPRSTAPRCPCGANTLRRAEQRGFACCREAGLKARE